MCQVSKNILNVILLILKMNKRTPNFTIFEKECLIEMIVNKYASTLEDKQTNRVSIDEKMKTWQKIETEFNNKAPIVCYRNSEQLRRFYENKKKELRKRMAEHKKQCFLTGGGSPPRLKLESTEEKLLQILNEKTVSGFHSEFDSDNKNEYSKINHTQIEDEMSYEFHQGSDLNSDLEAEHEIHNSPKMSQETAVLHDRYPPYIIEKSINQKLMVPSTSKTSEINPNNKLKLKVSRRRPVKRIKALTSSDIGEQYKILLNKRLQLIEKNLEQSSELHSFSKEEYKQRMNNLKIQEGNLKSEKEERLLKIKLLKLDIEHKKLVLSNN